MYYKVTLSTQCGLSKVNLESIKSYFTLLSHAFLAVEYGNTGDNCHVEGIGEFDTEKTSNVTARLKVLYKNMSLEWTPYSVKVRKATHLVGALIYASKELEGKGELLVIKGWKQSWIDLQVKDNVKAIPHKMLLAKWTRVTQNSGGPLMYEWAKANNMTVTCKDAYVEVKKQMASQGYLFGSCKDKGLYQDVCSCFGDGSASEAVAREALHFL